MSKNKCTCKTVPKGKREVDLNNYRFVGSKHSNFKTDKNRVCNKCGKKNKEG